jgi:outer membrane receptor protein involved in Fe transport
MKKIASYMIAFFLANILTISAIAQSSTISGKILNRATNESVSAVSVTIKGSQVGTFTDDKGNFKVSFSQKLPVTVLISSVGYALQEVVVNNAFETLTIQLVPSNSLGQEVVVSATKVAQKIMESPVSIERVSASNIRNSPVSSYYDILSSLKGVDFTTSSLTFKTPSTRGFNGSGSTRVNQIVDGMDNQAPGLNFSVGSVIGLTELDVDNIELLPGASSALYGPGGMNGTILINSKNPFKYQGLSFQVKAGVMNTDSRYSNASAYHNWSLRWAKKVSEKFAFKIGTEIISAKDWLGYDTRNYNRKGTTGNIVPGDRATDPNYDGVNVYGDETTTDIRTAVLNTIGASAAPFLKNFIDTLNGGRPINVSRTGYNEKDIVSPNTINFKFSGALHYKITPGIEAILSGYWGTGNTIYTGSERYSLRALKVGQYKLELNNKNWMVRAYTTQENSGESYNATVTARLFNENWKPSGGATGWFSQYSQAYLGARLGGMTDFDAQTLARRTADIGRPLPGSESFKAGFDKIRSLPIGGNPGGGLFVDRTDLYMVEGQYNLTHLTGKFADILVGANYKKYNLNSQGTLFADGGGIIGIGEYGGYIQATKNLFDQFLKLTVSGRYDKNDNFKGRFTPRATALFRVADNNNIRVSFQTAYRFPSTQQQWIDLDVGSNTRLLGGVPYFQDKYNLNTNTYLLSGLPSNTTQYKVTPFKAEAVSTYELGYKGLALQDKLLIDVYGYYGQYQDFLTRALLVKPSGTNTVNDIVTAIANNVPVSNVANIYSIPVNSPSKVKTYGFGLSIDYRLSGNFQVGANFSSDNLKDVPAGFAAYFSTPKYRSNITVGNIGFGPKKRLGFNVAYRWQDAFFFEGDFANETLPAIHTVDAQISLKLPATKSILKLGANNLLNQYYTNSAGNSIIGGLYYVSFAYNVF